MIDWIHEAIDHGSGIIINPAAYTFTSIAILDALKQFGARSSNFTYQTFIAKMKFIIIRSSQRSRRR